MLDVVGELLPCLRDPLLVGFGCLDDGRYHDLGAIAAYHRQVRPAYRAFLTGLKGEDLDRAIERKGRRTITYAWAVGHIAEHESYHIGKCTSLRSLLAKRSPEPG